MSSSKALYSADTVGSPRLPCTAQKSYISFNRRLSPDLCCFPSVRCVLSVVFVSMFEHVFVCECVCVCVNRVSVAVGVAPAAHEVSA